MIDVELPDGAGSPLVRSAAACLAAVTEVPLDALPDTARLTLPEALGAWRSWLAGRGAGLVPIAEPRTFAWAGWWLAVLDERTCVLAFGTPPGVVLSPQDPALLGRATADLPVTSAYAVASLDPVLPPAPPPVALAGTVTALAVAPSAEAPMQVVTRVCALAGRGLEGDRYADGRGTFSPGAARPGYDLTLVAEEALGGIAFAATRRNVLVRGLDVNALVGRDFTIGGVRCRGVRLAEPCAHLERVSGPGLLRPLISRAGLRVDVLSDGELTVGDEVSTT